MHPCHRFVWLLPALALGAQDPGKLSVDSLFHPSKKVVYLEAAASRLVWRPDGTLMEERQQQDRLTELVRVDPSSWEKRPLLTAVQFSAALVEAGLDAKEAADAFQTAFTWNPGQDAFLIQAARGLFILDVAKKQARRIAEAGLSLDAPTFSPDGARVAYLRGSDLYVTEVASGKETRLTTGGDEEHLNGRLDWVYQEEVFERGNFRAFWWSPDSSRLAFLSLDETQVPTYTLVDDRHRPQTKVTYRYPQAGDPNPVARLGVVDLEGAVTWMEDPFPGQETLVVQVGWDPQGSLLANYQDRVQSWLDCRRFNGPKSQSLVREESPAWVEHLPLPVFLKDGGFLWKSARTGFHHLYRYDAEGQLKGPVTAGSWDVRNVQGVDEPKGLVYFEGTQSNPIGQDTYRIDLASGSPNSHMRRITAAPGTHTVTFNAGFTAALDRWSDIQTPPKTLVINSEGQSLHSLETKTTPAFQAIRMGKVSFQTVPTRDGFPMETLLVLPPDFNPAKKYPVFHYIYGGPGAPLVKNAWNRSGLWFQFLAQQGIITWICDNRSASAKGAGSAHGIHGHLGAQELRDQLDGLGWLKAQGWADMDRVALHGYSYGGFFTAYALTHSKAWKIGIIGAPVVDWRLYDSVYTERYMGLPKENPKGYEEASALKAAANLSGKCMLIHGTLDDNVHPQNSVLFVDALEKAGQFAPLALLPGSTHSPRAPQHVWTMYESIWEFLKTNL